MTTERIAIAAVGEAFVREEADVEEPRLVILPWDSSKHNSQEEWTQKCGEVFRTNNGKFTYVCIQCNYNFVDIALFGDHLQNEKCELKTDYLSDDVGDSERIYSGDMDAEDDYSSELEAQMCLQKIENIELIPQTLEQHSEMHDIKSDENKNDDEAKNEKGFHIENNDVEVGSSTHSDGEGIGEIDSVSSKAKVKMKKQTKKPQSADDKPFCVICSRSYASESSFRIHLRQKHSDVLPVDILSKDVRELEMNLASSLEEMTCIYCFQCFENIDEFRKHATIHVGTHMFICKFCPKAFGSQYNRQVHMNTHEDIRPYKCSYCPRAFSSPPNLQNHERLHLNITRFTCNYCDKRFVKRSDRTVHERIHTKERPFQCEECGRRFITPIRLKEHKLRHQGIKNFKCSECDKTFYSNILLKNHMRGHSSERNYECKTCGRKFRRLSSLTQHMAIHSEVKKYVCKICEKAFAQFAGWYQHMKRHGRITK